MELCEVPVKKKSKLIGIAILDDDGTSNSFLAPPSKLYPCYFAIKYVSKGHAFAY